MLPPLASIDDLQARLPETIAESDEARAEAVLEDASTLVRAEAGTTWVTDDELDEDIPDIIVIVTLAAARRGFLNPDGFTQETLGDHSVSYGARGAVYLTAEEKSLIAAAVGNFALGTISTTRGDLETPAVLDCFAVDDTIEEYAPWQLMP